MNDSSIPNSGKACSAALGFFTSRRSLADHRHTRNGGWKPGSALDVLEKVFHGYSRVLKEMLHSLCLWELEKYNGVLLELWS